MNKDTLNFQKIVIRNLVSTLMCFAVVMIMSALLMAQQNSSGKIQGTVKDPDGASVSGAEVSLVHAYQATLTKTLTDATGNFVLDDIAPGNYELNVMRAGFGRHRSAVQVTDGDTKQLNLVLPVSEVSEEVTVTAEAGQVVDARTIAAPINLIGEKEILERATEVVAQVVDEEPGVNLQRTSPSLSAVFVRGLTGRNVAVYVDGVRYTTSAQRGGVGTFFSLIEPSTLETVEILRGPNSSQYGSDAHGGVVNFISHAPKYGGTESEFHGNTGSVGASTAAVVARRCATATDSSFWRDYGTLA